MTGWSQGNPRGLPEDHRDLPAPAVLQQQGPSSRLGRGQMKVGDGLRVPSGLNAPRSPWHDIPWVPRGSLQEVQQEGAAPRALPPVLSPSLSPSLAAPAPFSYLKGRSAVEFTPANDWLLLILATRTRRCGRADSDIVECDLEGLPAGHETAGSAAAVRTGRVPPRLGTAVAPTQQGGRGTWICPRTAPCEPREEADAQCPTSRPAS